MKLLKRLPTLALALVLTLGLVLPVFAEEEPAIPVITVQPKNTNIREVLIFRIPITLSVQAHIPNGDEVGYRWYKDGSPLYTKTESTLTLKDGGDQGLYYVEVFNKTNLNGQMVKSNEVRVAYEPTITRKILRNVPEPLVLEILLFPIELIVLPFVALYELFLLLSITVGPMIFLGFEWIKGLFQ